MISMSKLTRYNTSSKESIAYDIIDIKVDYENLTLKELKKELTIKEVKIKKREII
jgi:hypothetical protein